MATKTLTKKSSKQTTRQNTSASPTDLWTQSAPPLEWGREAFRFTVDRTKRQLDKLDIDPWVQTVDWQRSGNTRTGTLVFTQPFGEHTEAEVTTEDLVLCEWSQFGDGNWKALWRMSITNPQEDLLNGPITLTLASALSTLPKSKVPWKFRVDNTHPNGWTADQITVFAAKRFHIPLGTIPKGTYHIKKHVPKSSSAIDVITWAWTQEKHNTGRRFDVDTSTGVLNITEMGEPKYLLSTGPALLDGTVNLTINGVASAVKAVSTKRAHGSRKAEKLTVKVVDQNRLDTYGYIVKTLAAPQGIQSVSELKEWAKRRLAGLYLRRETLTFSHPGIPLLDRGSPLQIVLDVIDLNEIVFVTDIQHHLAAGSYTMDVTVGFNDPNTDTKATTTQQLKDKQAQKRGRATTDPSASSAPTPAKASTRSTKK